MRDWKSGELLFDYDAFLQGVRKMPFIILRKKLLENIQTTYVKKIRKY